MNWDPALHATYCPQHFEPPADGGGSSWLCCCTAENEPALSDFAIFYDAVDAAQKIDNTGGDSAVSVALWSWAELRARERVAAEDRAATVHLYGEERVAELEAEANRG